MPRPPLNHQPSGREVDSTTLSATELERIMSSSSDRFMLPPSAAAPDTDLARRILDALLQPRHWEAPVPGSRFPFTVLEVKQLCDQVKHR